MAEEALNYTQAFQQAIATTVTCKTLIKYNSNLNAEQKEEILNEIETTLAFLGKRLEVNASIEANSALSPEKLADLLIGDDEIRDGANGMLLETPAPRAPQEERELSLRHLHRLYQTYFSNRPGQGITDLEIRYKNAMHVLDQLEALTELRRDATASDLTVDGLFSRIRGFVTALYCMFREFAALLARIVEGQNIDIDTESMSYLHTYPYKGVQQCAHDITPLIEIYTRQHQIQQQRGSLREHTRDALAFLIFLQENLESTVARRQEIVAQIKSTAHLLNELTSLLSDYELAVITIMQSPPSALQ